MLQHNTHHKMRYANSKRTHSQNRLTQVTASDDDCQKFDQTS